MATAYWLQTPSGLRMPIGPSGVLIGRAGDCELVVPDPNASRRHALVRLGPDGPELVPFGSNPTRVDGQEISLPRALREGEGVEIAGWRCTVVVGPGAGPEDRWALATPTGERIPLGPGSHTLGGGLADDLLLPGLPPACARIDCGADGVVLSQTGTPAMTLHPGAEWEIAGHSFRLERVVLGGEHTTRLATQGLPDQARLSFLPKGGRLALHRGQAEVSLYLSERRCALVATLLQPPSGFALGEFIPDDRVIPRVWRNSGDRHSLNVLVARTRKDLAAVGYNGFALIERAPAGGATRFALAPGGVAQVV